MLLPTYIVEDIAQTCCDMAVLAHERLLFRDYPSELIQEATGHIWNLTASGLEKPDHGLTVVSMLHLAEGTQNRLVGKTATDYPLAQAAQPSLKDGYIWLMKDPDQAIDTVLSTRSEERNPRDG